MPEEVKPTPAPDNTQAVPKADDVVKPAEGATQKTPTPVDSTPAVVPTETPKEVAPVVPEKYDLKLSEGSLLSADMLEKVSQYSKELKLTNEQAQTVLAEREEAVASYVEERNQRWANEAKGDKEIGGEKLTESVEMSKRVVERFGPEIKAELYATGFGNSPNVIRFLTRIGKAMSDDQLVIRGAQGIEKPPIEERFYPNSKKEQK